MSDSRPDRPTGLVGDHADKLSRVRPLAHVEDERPSREDLARSEGGVFGSMLSVGRLMVPKRLRRK